MQSILWIPGVGLCVLALPHLFFPGKDSLSQSGTLICLLSQMQTSLKFSGKNYCNSGLQKVIKSDLPHKEHRCQLMGIHAMKLLTPSPSHKILITLFLLWYCHHNLLLFSSKKEDTYCCAELLFPPPAARGKENSKGAERSPAHTIAAFTLSH